MQDIGHFLNHVFGLGADPKTFSVAQMAARAVVLY